MGGNPQITPPPPPPPPPGNQNVFTFVLHAYRDWYWWLVGRIFLTIISCADPESFVRGGPNLITFFFSWWGYRGSKYHYKWAIVGLPAKCRQVDDGPTLNAGFVGLWFQGIARKLYILANFSGGSGPPVPPSGSANDCRKLPLKLLIFRLIIMYFGTLRMHQIAPF